MRKMVKLSRYLRARFRPRSATPLYWHVGRPNFGDDINPAFFAQVAGRKMRLEVDRDRPHFLGMGSILDRARPSSIVLGSGFMDPTDRPIGSIGRVLSVRGALSRTQLGAEDSVLLGDPMVLLDHVFPDQGPRGDTVGFVPHVTAVTAARKLRLKNINVIDPAMAPDLVISEIARCNRVFSQSLHGLIVADALRVPNCWVAPNEKMKGATFKFLDYFSTLDHAHTPLPFRIETFTETPVSAFHASVFQPDKRLYLEALGDILNTASPL